MGSSTDTISDPYGYVECDYEELGVELGYLHEEITKYGPHLKACDPKRYAQIVSEYEFVKEELARRNKARKESEKVKDEILSGSNEGRVPLCGACQKLYNNISTYRDKIEDSEDDLSKYVEQVVATYESRRDEVLRIIATNNFKEIEAGAIKWPLLIVAGGFFGGLGGLAGPLSGAIAGAVNAAASEGINWVCKPGEMPTLQGKDRSDSTASSFSNLSDSLTNGILDVKKQLTFLGSEINNKLLSGYLKLRDSESSEYKKAVDTFCEFYAATEVYRRRLDGWRQKCSGSNAGFKSRQDEFGLRVELRLWSEWLPQLELGGLSFGNWISDETKKRLNSVLISSGRVKGLKSGDLDFWARTSEVQLLKDWAEKYRKNPEPLDIWS